MRHNCLFIFVVRSCVGRIGIGTGYKCGSGNFNRGVQWTRYLRKKRRPTYVPRQYDQNYDLSIGTGI